MDQIAGRDASISRNLSHHPKKEYIFDPSGFRRLRLHEAISPLAIPDFPQKMDAS
jgi:hypothetical protein